MISIIKYNAGNNTSVQNALYRLGYDSVITDDKTTIQRSEKVIFPGVGEASTAMEYLKEKELDIVIKSISQPILGICLGLQLMCKSTEEENTECMGIFDTKVRLFASKKKVPHMGWNNFTKISGTLFTNINSSDDVYYVHSYYAEKCDHTIATCNYIEDFSAALEKDNYFATQFHPEKSATIGDKILKNFLNL